MTNNKIFGPKSNLPILQCPGRPLGAAWHFHPGFVRFNDETQQGPNYSKLVTNSQKDIFHVFCRSSFLLRHCNCTLCCSLDSLYDILQQSPPQNWPDTLSRAVLAGGAAWKWCSLLQQITKLCELLSIPICTKWKHGVCTIELWHLIKQTRELDNC